MDFNELHKTRIIYPTFISIVIVDVLCYVEPRKLDLMKRKNSDENFIYEDIYKTDIVTPYFYRKIGSIQSTSNNLIKSIVQVL